MVELLADKQRTKVFINGIIITQHDADWLMDIHVWEDFEVVGEDMLQCMGSDLSAGRSRNLNDTVGCSGVAGETSDMMCSLSPL